MDSLTPLVPAFFPALCWPLRGFPPAFPILSLGMVKVWTPGDSGSWPWGYFASGNNRHMVEWMAHGAETRSGEGFFSIETGTLRKGEVMSGGEPRFWLGKEEEGSC